MRDIMNIPPFNKTFGECFPAQAVGHCYESNYQAALGSLRTQSWLLTFPGISVEEKREKMLKWTKDRGGSA
jgi:hypothetical protein